MRPWLARLGEPTLQRLNALGEEVGLRTESGRPVRFVPPRRGTSYYEIEVFESGCVPTRAHSPHDLFNALAWLAFPRTKARINAMHAEEIPREGGRRGRKRDLLTLLDEGGVIVVCGDPSLMEMIRGFRWKELFWDNRRRVLHSLRFAVLGHGVLEKALQPWPGVTCKALPVGPESNADAAAAALLAALPADATPHDLPVVPVFGYPGWLPGSDAPSFYEDTRYFRPSGRKIAAGVGQAAAVQHTEESPGSAERDAG